MASAWHEYPIFEPHVVVKLPRTEACSHHGAIRKAGDAVQASAV